MKSIANLLIDSIAWEEYFDASGRAAQIGISLRELIVAKDEKAAELAYWKLENRIVAQGTVYDVAVPAIRVLVAAFLNDLAMPVRISILELLYQILSGATSELETKRDLVDECRILAAEGLWLIVREFVSGPRGAAGDVLACLDTDLDYESLIL